MSSCLTTLSPRNPSLTTLTVMALLSCGLGLNDRTPLPARAQGDGQGVRLILCHDPSSCGLRAALLNSSRRSRRPAGADLDGAAELATVSPHWNPRPIERA